MYTSDSSAFMRSPVGSMAGQFDAAYGATRRPLDGALLKKLDPKNFDAARDMVRQCVASVPYTRGNNHQDIPAATDMYSSRYLCFDWENMEPRRKRICKSMQSEMQCEYPNTS